jgi:uncharacterized membrane protein affecting hemolysin expression
MYAKILLILLLIVVLFYLGKALHYTIKPGGQGQQEKRLSALKHRLIFSVALILYLLIGTLAGWLTPHGIIP